MRNQDTSGENQLPGATPAPESAAQAVASPAVATPSASGEELSVVATGLAHPRGFTWGPDGALYVALAGDGQSPKAGDLPKAPPRPDAPPSVVRIEDGEVTPILHGLPSTQDPYGDVMGPADVGFLGDQLYVAQDAAGEVEDVGLAFPNGLYAAERGDSTRMVSSVTAYVGVNPAENLYHVLSLGEPFSMVADAEGTGFWIVDANQGLVLHVLPEGTLRVVADISLDHPVPTAVALAPDGAVLVGFLGPGPHLDGTCKIVKVTPNGDVYDYWTGLTMVTGIFLGDDGTAYALEMATGNTPEPPNIYPHTGRIVRQTGINSLEEVATGLNYPISMDLGPDGGIYVSVPAIATEGETGGVIRISPAAGETIAVPRGFGTSQARSADGERSTG